MNDKTAKKTARPSPRSGIALPLGAHPGNTGGKKGRSGRKPKPFKDWCRTIIEDETAKAAFEARAQDGDLQVFKFAAEYAEGRPVEKTEVGGEVTIRVVRVPQGRK